MKIYFNQHYSNRPYLNHREQVCFDTVYCGPEGLLSILMLHGGIVRSTVSAEERKAVYHNHMKQYIRDTHLFARSFAVDSFTASSTVLAWRDALVAAGWDRQCGDSPKLQFIREMEPKQLPQGDADYWNAVLRLAGDRPLLPEGSEVIVTQSSDSLEPKLARLFGRMSDKGVSIQYQADVEVQAEGNLGTLQRWLLNPQQEVPVIDGCDDTLELMHFKNEDDALRYIATQSPDRWSLYYCQQQKRFDNVLRMLGQPVCGSNLPSGEPQIVQLFTLGNGLFEYPLNLHRIIAWLNAPIHPLRRKLCKVLSDALITSGGIGNEVWQEAIDEYLEVELKDEKSRKRAKCRINQFLPFRASEELDIEEVVAFNRSLRSWAAELLAMDNFPYHELIRVQLQQLTDCCTALLHMLEQQTDKSISFVELQARCQSIVSPRIYPQYAAEAGCRSVIKTEGDVHTVADSLVWFCLEDRKEQHYPFDFLTETEYKQLEGSGVALYRKVRFVQMKRDAMAQQLLRTRKLTLVETDRIGGELVQRHPLMLQLASVAENIGNMFRYPDLPSAALQRLPHVNNRSDELMLQLDENAVLHPRWERAQAESYSSLDLLIQHPFDYVCRYCARLRDTGMPTVTDKNKTLGTVAHLIIEKVFKGTTQAEQRDRMHNRFKQIFDEAVNQAGLLLRQREHAIDLRNMKTEMKKVLQLLQEILINNGLTVDDCEYPFRPFDWTTTGDHVKLEARADMLLTDRLGNKVIFDFKWSNNKTYKESIERNTALQLAIYKHLAQKEFGCSVRTAYILLPGMEFLSGDAFDEDVTIPHDTSVNVMQLAANSYAWRWKQFAVGQIERAEGCSLSDSSYGTAQEAAHLFPLKVYKDVIGENHFDEYKKLR